MAPRSPISPSSATLRAQRLSVIAEDGTVLPPIPARSANRTTSNGSPQSPRSPSPSASYSNASVQTSNRPQSRRWTDKPPHHSADASPPGYEHWDDGAPRSKRAILLEKVRGNRQIARRGGWKRLVIALVVLIAVIIALGVGLGVGLTQRNNANNSNDNNADGENSTQTFPEGSYAIPVYSSIVDTSCTAISSTWLCYPYNTYNSANPSNSLATYTWIISSGSSTSSSSSQPSSFNISTTQNPFADIFTNVPLTLVNAGTADEYYTFSVSLQKVVVPRTSIAANGATTNCYYNNTLFQAQLYTRKASMNISASAAASASSIQQDSSPANNWQHWPYAVNVTQSISGGNGVPDCYALNADGSTGARVTTGLTPQDSGKSCVCGYRNFGF